MTLADDSHTERPAAIPQELTPDVDFPRTGRRRRTPVLVPQEYQRLVANPFLALFGFLIGVLILRQVLIDRRHIGLSIVALIWLAATVSLLHYHCLDCGRTGWLFRWRDHACEHVLARQVSGRVRRFRGPNPMTQSIIWLYILFSIALLFAIVLGLA